MNILNILSTVVLILIAVGLMQRKLPSRHWPLMLLAFSLDFGIVLYLELTREATKAAVSAPPPMLIFHIIVSGIVGILYLVQFYLGYRLLTGKLVSSSSHRIAGIAFIILRLINYVTSFILPIGVAATAVS